MDAQDDFLGTGALVERARLCCHPWEAGYSSKPTHVTQAVYSLSSGCGQLYPKHSLPRSPASVWAPGLRSPPCWRREGGHPGRLARLSVRIKSRLELRSRGRPLLGALAASLSREQLPRRLGSREALRAGGARSCPHCMPNHCSWSAHWAASLSLPSRSPSSPLPSMSSTSSS